jgi:16S rRNA processing protein RimM
MSDQTTPMICVGAISGAFGVRGDIRLKSFCADPGAIADYAPLSTEDGTRQFDLKLTGQAKGVFTARISGVSTKEQADALRGVRLFAPRERLPGLPDDEYYYADLIGLSVVDTGGAPLGTVIAVQNHGADDLLEIKRPTGGDTLLLPFTRDGVPTVDLAARRIVADPPDGLL